MTSRVPVEGKSSVCVICMKYRIIILIIIIISLGQIILSYMANTSLTHARTHACTRTHLRTHPPTAVAVQVVAVRWVGVRPTMTKLMSPFHLFRWRWMAGRCFIQINSGVCDAVSAIVLGVFRVYIFYPNWDANSWQDVLSVDVNSLIHLPRRSSKNFDLQFANFDRFNENYSID